jgi:hypothetical protein
VNEYRAFIVGQDGHFASCRTFCCTGDAEAIVWTKQLLDGREVELWSGERFIVRLRGDDGEATFR